MKKIIRNKILSVLDYVRNDQVSDQILINQGKILSKLNAGKLFNRISDYEWKIFSQWGEDGIIDYLTSEVPLEKLTFIEFGVESFKESNCRFLMVNKNFRGFVIDGSRSNINKLRNTYYYWRYDIQSINAFITRENINELLQKSGFDRDLGILSVDIDGNDYHVLKEITNFSPRILICEFNPLFGKDRTITVPYEPDFYRTDKHYSNLYYGVSISALRNLAKQRGYTLVGTTSTGGNAFFVRNDMMTQNLRDFSIEPLNYRFNVRESRDKNGSLSYLRSSDRYQAIKGLDILNTTTGHLEKL